MSKKARSHPYLVGADFRIARAPTAPPRKAPGKGRCKERLAAAVERLGDLQKRLFADDRYAVLVVFQAMDAAGKDGTIRAVMTGINPAGCQVFAFKRPSDEELDHDFLWRIWQRLPERGRIGIFNRSHYEEVLVARVRPEILDAQKLPHRPKLSTLFEERYDSIRDVERHLARNGTVVLKLFLHVSKDEQAERLRARIDEPEANWKFEAGDLDSRARWDEYMRAYEAALRATSRPWAPWYAIPADDKHFMRMTVAELLADTLEALPTRFPEPSDEEREKLRALRGALDG